MQVQRIVESASRLASRRNHPGQSADRGMTLIEILVVLAIISLIIGGVGVVAFGQLAKSKIKNTQNEVRDIPNLCEIYMLEKNNKCPKDLGDLKAAGVISRVTKDAWGNDYVITCPGEHGPVDVLSYGPDGQPGGDDDLVSWSDDVNEDDKKDK